MTTQTSFIIPPTNPKAAKAFGSPKSVERRRQMAEALLAKGMDTSPIGSPWQGAARMAQALVGGLGMRRADAMEQEGQQSAADAFAQALQGGKVSPEAFSNPYMNPAQGQILANIYERSLPQPPKYQQFTTPGGDVMRYDENSAQPSPQTIYDAPDQGGFRPATAEEKTQYGVAPDAPLVFDPTGKPSILSAGGVTVNTGDQMKLSESQSKDLGYYGRGKAADQALAPLEKSLTDLGGAAAAQAPMLGNYLKSPEYKQAEQAGREFIAAILRKDSGATITPDEMANYGAIFLPQPGDDDKTLANKRASRARAMQVMRLGLGNAQPMADAIDQQLGLGANAPQQQPLPQGGPQPGTVEEGFRFKGGDPADPNNWEPVQ